MILELLVFRELQIPALIATLFPRWKYFPKIIKEISHPPIKSIFNGVRYSTEYLKTWPISLRIIIIIMRLHRSRVARSEKLKIAGPLHL